MRDWAKKLCCGIRGAEDSTMGGAAALGNGIALHDVERVATLEQLRRNAMLPGPPLSAKPFEECFDGHDILYGISAETISAQTCVPGPRHEYFQKLRPDPAGTPEIKRLVQDSFNHTYLSGKAYGYYAFIDVVNDRFIGTSFDLYGPQDPRCSYLGKRRFEGKNVREFRVFLENDTRYDPRPVALPSQGHTRLGRACKGGLVFAAVVRKVNVHFILDKIDMQRIVAEAAEKKPHQRTYTGKELRKVYRMWGNQDLRSQVLFWRQFHQVLPPWQQDKALWDQYVPRRFRDHSSAD